MSLVTILERLPAGDFYAVPVSVPDDDERDTANRQEADVSKGLPLYELVIRWLGLGGAWRNPSSPPVAHSTGALVPPVDQPPVARARSDSSIARPGEPSGGR